MDLRRREADFVTALAEEAEKLFDELVEYSKERNEAWSERMMQVLTKQQRKRFHEILFQRFLSLGDFELILEKPIDRNKNQAADRKRQSGLSAATAVLELDSRIEMLSELGDSS